MERPLVINEDFANFFTSNKIHKMTAQGMLEQLRCYKEVGATQINFCVNGMRAMFKSRSFEPIWSGLTPHGDTLVDKDGRPLDDAGLPVPLPVAWNAIHCHRLCQEVPNHLQFRIDEGRKMGMRIFLSQRMNDVHISMTPECQLNSDFWRNHPEYYRADHQTKWSGRGLDYAQPEVYEYFMGLTRELLEDFDLDGLELDWLRTPPFFRVGQERAGRAVLDRYLQETHQLILAAQERLGHPVELMVRVPSRPDDTLRLGMDVGRWCKEGWVKRVAVGGYWQTTDCDIPFEWWRMWLGEDVIIEGSLDLLCLPYQGFPYSFYNTAEIVSGFGAAMLHRGADAIYLFNHMDGDCGMLDKSSWKENMRLLKDLPALEKSPRRHVVTFLDYLGRPDGMPSLQMLPVTPSTDGVGGLRLYIGRIGGNRRRVVRLGFRQAPPAPEQLQLWINGVSVSAQVASEKPELPPEIAYLWECEIPEGVLLDGDNVIEFKAKAPFSVAVDWCEIYLGPEA